jgi:hypothetical protein
MMQVSPAQAGGRKPAVSVVVVVYNIPREAPRTLFSLSASYQRHIHSDDYEVIVVDNGSTPPFDRKVIESLAGNFRLIRIDNAPSSPARAINRGLSEARGDVIGVMIDGARIVTPGLLHFALHGSNLYPRAVVAGLGWYLGYDFQSWAKQAGYDQAREDALLASIDWPQDGYRLFEIATPDQPSVDGWFLPLSESNALFLHRQMWNALGEADERFNLPGGGFLIFDICRNALELAGAELVVLLGEGTFHQLHDGITTNAGVQAVFDYIGRSFDQYKSIRGAPFERKSLKSATTYLGTLPRAVLSILARAAIDPVVPRVPRNAELPLGPLFDRALWSLNPPALPADPTISALVQLAHNEFRASRYEATAAVARLARDRAPDEPEPQRLLSLIGAWSAIDIPFAKPSASYHLALGEAYRLLGENEQATLNYRAALSYNRNLAQAHIGLATLSMPGDSYCDWLDRLYTSLAPESLIEIGIGNGASLSRVRPPTIAIGIDPNPTVIYPLKAETHIFPETSDQFFARRGPDALLAGRPVSIGFIDGLHLYEQALRDFINLESYCGPRSVILFHDTMPLDEPTQSRACETQFHTGDVWKTVLCLKHYRPDLDIFTIAAPWTGLTVVTGLDPASRVLTERYEEAVARFIDTPYSEIAREPQHALNIVANDWHVVETRLKARRIL